MVQGCGVFLQWGVSETYCGLLRTVESYAGLLRLLTIGRKGQISVS